MEDNQEYSRFKATTATSESDYLKLYQDPTYLSFKLMFAGINGDIPGFLGNEGNNGSALYYLKQIGDNARFNMLKDFHSLLIKLNTEFPWYFQSIEGLDEAWKRDFNIAKFKKEITINCLESIDLRITTLVDLYRKITTDWKHRRYILPDNLRRFNLTVRILDFRKFNQIKGESETINNKNNINNSFLGEDFSVTNQITFNLSHCEIMTDDSGTMLGTINNTVSEMATQMIKISYEEIEEDNIYRLLSSLGNNKSHYYVKDYLEKELNLLSGESPVLTANQTIFSRETPNSPSFIEGFQEQLGEKNQFSSLTDISRNDREAPALGNIYGINTNDDIFSGSSPIAGLANDISENVSNEAAGIVANRLNSLYLGNVFGFSTSTFNATLENRVINKPGDELGNIFS